jgi:putative YhdH/YhfP family quinone oxidoreductase
MRNNSFSLDFEIHDGLVQAAFKEREIGSPNIGEVKVAIEYSSINYRDLLAFKGNRAIARRYPYTPGVDFVGHVLESRTERFVEGEKVALFAAADRECFPGGWSNFSIVKADRLIRLHEHWPLECVAAVGTAGLAAASALDFISRNSDEISDQHKLCAVTGSTGGVGSLACLLAAKTGFKVTAVVRNLIEAPTSLLFEIGVEKIIDLNELIKGTELFLGKQEYDVAIDTIGGKYTTALAKKLKNGGAMGVCGLVAGQELHGLDLLPFLMRGIAIGGSGAEIISGERRHRVLNLMREIYMSEKLKKIYTRLSIYQIPKMLESYETSKPFGRIVIKFE